MFPGERLQPTDAQQAARMNQIMGIVDWYVFPDISAGISYQRLVTAKHGKVPDEARVAESLPKARICLDALDRRGYQAGDGAEQPDPDTGLSAAPRLRRPEVRAR